MLMDVLKYFKLLKPEVLLALRYPVLELTIFTKKRNRA